MNFNPVFAAMLICALLVLCVGQWFARRQTDDAYERLRIQLLDSIEVNASLTVSANNLRSALADTIRERNAANVRAARAAQQIHCLPEHVIERDLPVGVHIGPFSVN